MKKYILPLKLLLMLSLLIFLLAFARQRFQQKSTSELELKIDYSSGNRFVDKNTVYTLLNGVHPDFPKVPLSKITPQEWEHKLEENAFVKHAEVYWTNQGKVIAEVAQEVPVLRVNTGSEQFYITQEGKRIPLSSHFSAKVLLIAGNVQPQDYLKLSELVKLINEDKLLKTHVIGIQKQSNKSFILLVNDWPFDIEIGELANLGTKFQHFHLFYEQYIQHAAKIPYKTINIAYNNQIVAKK